MSLEKTSENRVAERLARLYSQLAQEAFELRAQVDEWKNMQDDLKNKVNDASCSIHVTQMAMLDIEQLLATKYKECLTVTV